MTGPRPPIGHPLRCGDCHNTAAFGEWNNQPIVFIRHMSESASVERLSAEVRVVQVGSRQITRSMYRQLDEATFERFEPFGRVRDNKRKPVEGVLQLVGRDTKTGALVRHNARPPRWTKRDGPPEFAHWLRHQAEPS